MARVGRHVRLWRLQLQAACSAAYGHFQQLPATRAPPPAPVRMPCPAHSHPHLVRFAVGPQAVQALLPLLGHAFSSQHLKLLRCKGRSAKGGGARTEQQTMAAANLLLPLLFFHLLLADDTAMPLPTIQMRR